MGERASGPIPVEVRSITQRRRATIAVVGIPNCGKSTLFNRLTGLRQKTANYPGATVEKTYGMLELPGGPVELLDLPGTYSLGAHTVDEGITADSLLGRMPSFPRPSAVLAVLDATNLSQGLFLIRQVVELGLPVVVALTMHDVAIRKGLKVDIEQLGKLLGGVPVLPVVATTGEGIATLKQALNVVTGQPPPSAAPSWPALKEAALQIAEECTSNLSPLMIERALVDRQALLRADVLNCLTKEGKKRFDETQMRLFGDQSPLAAEARIGHEWARSIYAQVVTASTPADRIGANVLAWINRPLPATVWFLAVMVVVFQAVFAWATPVMDLIDEASGWLGSIIAGVLAEGALRSFLVDGVIAGVGSVVIFLPQILLLFLFIILLEDTGYLARSAFLMDRVMRALGLSGQSVIPMLSSFACAVPSIMATRVIPTRGERIATIMAAPFMTCSARLPIYALLIAAFVPEQSVGLLNLQGLVLFGLYLLGMAAGALTALLVNRFALRGERGVFAMTLPEFRWPNWRTVLIQLIDRVRIFLRRAGTIIFTVAVLVWFLAYFPRLETPPTAQNDVSRVAAKSSSANTEAAAQLAQSWLGRAGRFVEPVFEPLGWDWRVSASVIAGFPAREVVVAVMGTIYAVGAEADHERLSERLHRAQWPDGRQVFTLPMVLGLLIFYAWCLQCAATLAVIRRETNSWRWPLFAWSYMTSLGYLGALAVFQLGS